MTHINIVLLPKKKETTPFSNTRPMSLSNFINNVFSIVIHERPVDLVPNLISDEKSSFVRGRTIIENILFIRSKTKAGANVLIKLDMTKVYDRISWLFLKTILRKIRFNERFIGFVYVIVLNN